MTATVTHHVPIAALEAFADAHDKGVTRVADRYTVAHEVDGTPVVYWSEVGQ